MPGSRRQPIDTRGDDIFACSCSRVLAGQIQRRRLRRHFNKASSLIAAMPASITARLFAEFCLAAAFCKMFPVMMHIAELLAFQQNAALQAVRRDTHATLHTIVQLVRRASSRNSAAFIYVGHTMLVNNFFASCRVSSLAPAYRAASLFSPCTFTADFRVWCCFLHTA